MLKGRDALKLLEVWIKLLLGSPESIDADKEFLVSGYKKAIGTLHTNRNLRGALEFERLQLALFELSKALSNQNTQHANVARARYINLSTVEKKIAVYTRETQKTFDSKLSEELDTIVQATRQYCLNAELPTRQDLRVRMQIERMMLTGQIPFELNSWEKGHKENIEMAENDEFIREGFVFYSAMTIL